MSMKNSIRFIIFDLVFVLAFLVISPQNYILCSNSKLSGLLLETIRVKLIVSKSNF